MSVAQLVTAVIFFSAVLDFWKINLEKSSSTNWIFSLFTTWFYCLCSLQKFSLSNLIFPISGHPTLVSQHNWLRMAALYSIAISSFINFSNFVLQWLLRNYEAERLFSPVSYIFQTYIMTFQDMCQIFYSAPNTNSISAYFWSVVDKKP